MAGWHTVLILAAAWQLAAAQVPDLSGTWRLNVARSTWDNHPKPASAVITIEHHEPELKYSGTVIFPTGVTGGEHVRTYAFDGAVDGKDYPVTGTLGQGKMQFHRVNPAVLTSRFVSSDGSLTQTARTTLSPDGRTLVRDIHSKGPNGDESWTEVYDRQ